MNGLSVSEITARFNAAQEKGTDLTLGAFFADELTTEQKQSLTAVEGLGIDNSMYTPIRDYPMGESVAHIVGYTGYPEKRPEGYTESDRMGISGLEAAYEGQLRGSDGKIIYIEDRWGRNVRTYGKKMRRAGSELTIKRICNRRVSGAAATWII